MRKTHPSADQPTARMLPMAASLERIRLYSIILICIAISKVKAFWPTPGCCSDMVGSLTAPLDKLPMSASRLACGLRYRQYEEKKKRTKKESLRGQGLYCDLLLLLFSDHIDYDAVHGNIIVQSSVGRADCKNLTNSKNSIA